jgi:hypothetical protein
MVTAALNDATRALERSTHALTGSTELLRDIWQENRALRERLERYIDPPSN